MPSTPLVTVIVTVYKRTRYLKEALDSIVAQTCADFEVIVTDDSNLSAIRDICAEYAQDGRVRYRANLENQGAPLNVAAAMKEAVGEYVTIFNDDDVMEPDMLEKLLPPLVADPGINVAFGDHWMTDPAGEILRDVSEKNSVLTGRHHLAAGRVENPLSFVLAGGVPFVMGTLFRRSAYRDDWLARGVAGSYDLWLAIRFALLDGSLSYVDFQASKHRLHEASETSRADADKAACDVYLYDRLLLESLSPQVRVQVEDQLAHQWFILGRDRLYHGRSAFAAEAFRQALRHRFRGKALFGLALTVVPASWTRVLLSRWRSVREIKAPLPAAANPRP